MNYTSISRLVMTPVLAGMIVLVLLNASSIYKSFILLNDFDELENTLVQAERDVTGILNTFKTQVQEWKNVLLRGHNQSDRDKYWSRFQQREREIVQASNQLLQNPAISSEAKAQIRQFKASHQVMAARYREGYQAFIASGYDPKTGDSFVRGIDREPAVLLGEVATAIAVQSQNAFNVLNTSTRRTQWVILLAAIVLSVVVLFYVVLRLRKQVILPIKKIASSISSLAANRYDHSLTYTSKHELGLLADSARALQAKLHQTVSTLRQSEQQMGSAVSTLGDVSAQIQQGAVEQRDASESLDSSTATLRTIAQNLVVITSQVAVATEQAELNVGNCYNTFKRANQGFKQLAESVSHSSDIVNVLQTRSAHILKAVNVINDIADQTNLLALNAAIEAARAGEHGRGFAVVADEVRALAANTQQSTKEINNILSGFESEARGAVEAMQQGKALSEHNAQEANSALTTLNLVVNSIQETASAVVALNSAADEQKMVLESVEHTIGNVVRSSQRYHALSQRNDISHSMRNMAENVEQVVRSLTGNRLTET